MTRYSKVLSFIMIYCAELARHTQTLAEACFLIVHWGGLHSWLTLTGRRSRHPYDEVKNIAHYLEFSPPPTTRYRAQDQEEEVKALLCWLEELMVVGNDAFLGLFKEVDTLKMLESGGDLLPMLEYWEQRQERIQAMKPWAEEVERAMWKTRRLLGSRVSGDERPWSLFDEESIA